jgi:hypothetical protein
MMNHPRLRLTQIALSLSIALAAAPSFAQNTTSAIGGRVSGADGKPASGATVTIVHTESGSVNNVVTDAEGRYVARGLRAGGPYTITITKNGVTEKQEGVFVEVAAIANVDATLGAPAVQTVTIAGVAGGRSDKFSKTTMGSGTSISSSELAIQGSISRSLQDYARTDPRVSQTDKDRGEMSVAGQNSRFNSMTIDGVAVSDTFGLEASGSPTAKQPISIEAIQSVQVNVANYDVTQKGYTGGNINAATKSGTNKFKGSVYYVFRNDSMVGERYNAGKDTYFDPTPFKETTKGFTLGGPIIQDKLFFFANYEKLEKPPTTLPTHGPLGSAMTNVAITPAAISQAQSIAQTKYNMDIGTSDLPQGSMLSVEDRLLKLDWNVNDDHRVMVRYSKTEQAEPWFNLINANNLSLSSWWYSQKKVIETKVAQWTGDWTPSLSTELKISSRDYDSVPENFSKLPAISLSFNGALPAGASTLPNSRSLNFGTENSRQFNALRTKTLDTYFGATWTHNAHEVKFGADYAKNEIFNAFLQNTYGNYSFGCISSPAVTYTFGNVNCGTASAADVERAVLENFSRGRPSSYSLTVAAPGATLEKDAAANFTMKNTGLFIQDVWTVSPALTLSYGVRLDSLSIPERPLLNAAVAAPVIAATAASGGRQTGGFGIDNQITFDGQKLWQPRVGFNYKLPMERQTQLRGGAGLFQGAAAAVWLANPFQNNGVATRVIACNSSRACPTTDGTFTPEIGKAPPNLATTTPQALVDSLAPGLRQPSVWKANIAFDHELPWYGMVLGAELLKTKAKDAIYYRNLNLGAPTRTGVDGRELYYSENAFSTACWDATGTMRTSGTFKDAAGKDVSCAGTRNKYGSNSSYANVLQATRSTQGYSNLGTLSLSRPLTGGFGWSVSYTYTDAKEVSPLTSSTSGSTYNGRSVLNPNEDVVANSSYLVKDRINAVFNFQKRFFGTYNTRVGVFYEGRAGKPFSWTVNNDMNGDAIGGNDLMYIPSAPGSGEVVFAGANPAERAAAEAKFWDVVNHNGVLKRHAGKVVGRNTDFSPWSNSVDMRISQEIPSFIKGHKASFTFDIFNVGNLINKKWGRINEVAFQGGGAQARSFVDFVGMENGKYVYKVRDKVEDLEVRQGKGESQWAIQATVKYEF